MSEIGLVKAAWRLAKREERRGSFLLKLNLLRPTSNWANGNFVIRSLELAARAKVLHANESELESEPESSRCRVRRRRCNVQRLSCQDLRTTTGWLIACKRDQQIKAEHRSSVSQQIECRRNRLRLSSKLVMLIIRLSLKLARGTRWSRRVREVSN